MMGDHLLNFFILSLTIKCVGNSPEARFFCQITEFYFRTTKRLLFISQTRAPLLTVVNGALNTGKTEHLDMKRKVAMQCVSLGPQCFGSGPDVKGIIVNVHIKAACN